MNDPLSSGPPSRVLHWKIWPWLAAILSGILLTLCFPPFNQGWLVWVGLAPLAAAVWWPRPESPASSSRFRRVLSRSRPFLLGYLAGVIFFTGSFHWLGALGVLFSSTALFGLPLLLAVYMGAYFGLWTWFLHALVRPGADRFTSSWRNLGLGAAGACMWVTAEWVRSWLFSGFGWNSLGAAMHRDLAMIQIADLTGVFGLSWLAAFANVMAVVIVRRLAAEFGPTFLKRVRWEFSATMALIAIVFSYGVRALLAPLPPGVPLHMATLQPNIPEELKFGDPAEHEEIIFAEYSRLNAVAAALEPQLIIWPEAATPRGIFADSANREFLRQEAARGNFSLLIGSLEPEINPANPEEMRTYNSAVLFTQQGAKYDSYRKMHLVIFGEYVPFRPLMPSAVNELVPGDLAVGTDFKVFTLPAPALRLGPLVCFEDTVPRLARGLTRQGAQLLVNITNDAWFLHSAGAEDHLANATLRAVENRRPLLRCTNTGVTCWIDSHGRVDRWLPPFEQGVATREVSVPATAPLTFYTRHGDWIAHLSAVVTALTLLLRVRRGHHNIITRSGA